MSTQPPAGPPQLPEPGSMHCPRCSATVGPDQDWCLECGAPARTRLAPTPNWRVPTLAIGAVVLLAGALLAFAFVKLTGDDNAPAGTTPAAVVETTAPPVVAPPAATTATNAVTTPPTTAVTPLPSTTTTATTPKTPDTPGTVVQGTTTTTIPETPSTTTTVAPPSTTTTKQP